MVTKKTRKKQLPSIKQRATIEALENGAKTLKEAGLIAGYSEATTKATLYRLARTPGTELNTYINNRYTKEVIDLDIQRLEQDCKDEKDRSNNARLLELRAKIGGLTRDSNNSINILGDDVVNSLLDRLGCNTIDNNTIDVTPQELVVDTPIAS